MTIMALLAAAYGVAVNVLAFTLFRIDKRRAAAGAWRIRESTLIAAALAGGWIGAKAAQRRFRHKTRKQPFARRLNAAGLVLAGGMLVGGALAASPLAEARLGRLLDGGLRVLAAEVAQGFGPGSAAGEGGARDRPLPHRFGPGSEEGR